MHQYPELSFHEVNTARWIAEQLKVIGCEVKEEIGGHGLVVDIVGGKPGPVVALRADIDALPIQDEKSCEYSSTVPGVMHACGHDGHTAGLLAVAAYYEQNKDQLEGVRRLLFQPAEETTPGGAIRMIEAGALEGAHVIYGVHLWTPLPYGQISTKPGPFMAATDEFTIHIIGRGGHGGMPQDTVDTVLVGSAFVQAVQSIVSRSVNPLHSAVVTIGAFQAGTANNVIAEKCQLKGTIRSFDPDTRKRIYRRLEDILEHVCRMYGASWELDLRVGYPAVVNDDREAGRCLEAAADIVGADSVVTADALMVAEDFSYYLDRIPGCFTFVGAGNPACGAAYPHHHPKFDLDERAMVHAAQFLIHSAESYTAQWI